MANLWERERDEDAGGPSLEEYVMAHIEEMRSFLESHNVMMTIRITPVEKLIPYDATQGTFDVGGRHEPLGGGDWLFLVPLREVTSRQALPN